MRGGLAHRGTAWLAVALGFVGGSLGVGIGLRHLQVAGMSVGAAAALVALAAGLTATVLGATTLIRGVRGWQQWLTVPVGLLLVWFLAWPLTVALMVTNVPPTRPGYRDAGRPRDRLRRRDVHDRRRVRLSAWHVPSATARPWSFATARPRPGRTRWTRWSSWPGTATACWRPMPVAMAAAAAWRWTEAGSATSIPRPPSRTCPDAPTSTRTASPSRVSRWAARKPSAQRRRPAHPRGHR